MITRRDIPSVYKHTPLSFGDDSKPPKEESPADTQPKETQPTKPVEIGRSYRPIDMRPVDDDKDEDPQAQRAREWAEYHARRKRA